MFLTWVLLVWLAAASVTPGFCSWPLPRLSALCCVCGLRPAGRCVWGALPLVTVDFTGCDSLSASEAASLVGRTMVRLALGSWGCCSPLVTVTGFTVVAEPSPAPFTPTESVVAALFFRQRLTPRSAFPLLRLDSLCAGEEGGWGWSCGCEEDSLGFSDESKATGFSSSLSLLVSVGTASFSFLFDWSRMQKKKHFILTKSRVSLISCLHYRYKSGLKQDTTVLM